MNSNLKIEPQGIELLTPNHAGAMQLKNGSTANYGVIHIVESVLIHFTGKGLREIWKPVMTEEEQSRALELRKLFQQGQLGQAKLIASGHIAATPIAEIDRVIF